MRKRETKSGTAYWLIKRESSTHLGDDDDGAWHRWVVLGGKASGDKEPDIAQPRLQRLLRIGDDGDDDDALDDDEPDDVDESQRLPQRPQPQLLQLRPCSSGSSRYSIPMAHYICRIHRRTTIDLWFPKRKFLDLWASIVWYTEQLWASWRGVCYHR